MGSDYSNWEGMLKGWIPADLDEPHHHHCGNYRPPAVAHRLAPPKWRGVAQKYFMPQKPSRVDYDIEDLVFDMSVGISTAIQEWKGCLDPSVIEEFLDELQAYGEDIDVFHVLDSDRTLAHILPVLNTKHANLRAKGAELITTLVQKYPTNQELVIKGNGLHLLLHNLTEDPDATSRSKALRAISALLRNNKPGMNIFRQAEGYARLRGAVCSKCVGIQRDALDLIQYLLLVNSSDCNIVTELGFPLLMMHLASSDDAEVRKAVLRILLLLAREEESRNNLKNDDSVEQILQKLIEGINAMAPEDLGSARDEIQLVDSVWNACYNEPSSLAKKGLLVLPGEDAPVPNVASKLFEPPLRALATAEAADGNSLKRKKHCL